MTSSKQLKESDKKKWLRIFWEEPHKLGHAIGFTKLIKDHSEWIKYIWAKEGPERGLQAHRNSYKTTGCTVLGPIWYLLYNPQDTILLLREEMGNAISTVMEITDKYKNINLQTIYHELYGIYPFTLKRENQKSIILPTKIDVGREGNIDAAGIKTSLTGRHYTRIHTDDFITLKDRVSKAKRESGASLLRELRNVEDLEFGQLTHTGTPWHKDDPWKLIPNVKKFPLGKVNIPFIMDNLEEAKNRFRSGTTASLYAANYELKHIADEGALFTNSQWIEDMIADYQPVGQLDCAYKGDNLTALTLIQERDITVKGQLLKNQFVTTGFVWPGNIMDMFPRLQSIFNRLKMGTLHLEDNADKGFAAKDIREFHFNVREYHESMNKHVKITTYLPKYWHKIWFTPETMPEYVDLILDYQEGQEPDDPPDSCASLIREVFDTTDVVDEEFAINDTSYINDDGRGD